MAQLDGTGRHLTTEELRLWTSFLDAGRMIEQAMAADLAVNHAMSHREYEVLVRLDGAAGSMRMSELARQVAASAPLITQTIVRLEERDWVRRERSAGDSRGIDAVLTRAGRAALAEAATPHARLIRKLLLDLVGPDRLPHVAASMGDVADHLRNHRRDIPCERTDCPIGSDGLPNR